MFKYRQVLTSTFTFIKDDEPASIALVDKATYMLASSLQEIAYKNSKLSDNIMSVLWSLARRIIDFVNEEDGKCIILLREWLICVYYTC